MKNNHADNGVCKILHQKNPKDVEVDIFDKNLLKSQLLYVALWITYR